MVVGACGDPLAGIEKTDDVELASTEPVAQVSPDAEGAADEGGLFSRLLGPKPSEDANEVVDVVAIAQDADAGETTDLAATERVEPQPEDATGLRGWLRRSGDRAKDVPASEETATPVIVATAAPLDPASDAIDVAVEQASEPDSAAAPAAVVQATVEPEKRTGLLGLFTKAQDAPEATVRTASLQTKPDQKSDAPGARVLPELEAAVEPKKRRGLFGTTASNAPRTGPDAQDVGFGEVLPYGQIARVCTALGRSLGRKIDKFPARGRGYTLYDSDPNSTSPRTFYITGFNDDCPRQFTASLALLGAPSLHEQLRYGRPSSEYPYSTTDKAYEKVKSSVCRVGKRKPCGAKIGVLEKNTIFISTYERFGGNARWADFLIHDGAVLAAAIKTP